MQNHNGTIFLRLLLNRYFPQNPDTLAKIMPAADHEKLKNSSFGQSEPNVMLFLPQKWLASMDPSWLKPMIEKLSPPLQKVYENAFPHLFSNKESESAYNETVQDFLIYYLHSTWKEETPPPKELLDTWELSPLLNCSRQELLEIVDLLSMHDLVEEMRHIVDKRVLQLVLQHLTKLQQQYLRLSLRQKSRKLPSTLSVKELLKEGKNFPQMLHKFGLKRLAVALSGASDEFLWHITHRIDMPRAKFLQNHVQKEEVQNQTEQAILQIQHVIQFLKPEAAS